MSSRRIRVDVQHKTVKVDFDCFEGETCVAERERLRQALLELGIKTDMRDRVARPVVSQSAETISRATNEAG